MMKEIYIAEFNPCIYKSEYGIISIHRKKDNAQIAKREHKKKYLVDYGIRRANSWEKWRVKTYSVED
jgi:hypothetical protein